jgi:deoxyribonuclease-4
VHPGSYTSSSEQAGIKQIGKALDEIHQQARTLSARCLLETTAGQGTNLGWKFEQLAGMLEATRYPDQVGIFLDTCHVFAAGLPQPRGDPPLTHYVQGVDTEVFSLRPA